VKSFRPVPRANVMHHIMQQMKDAMASGALRRGDRLPPEPTLAEQFGVSRASLREVLKVLESLGIIETRRGAGTFIAKAPRRQVADSLLFLLLLEDGTQEQLVELRYVLESSFTRLAQRRLDAVHIEKLEASIRRLEQAVEAGTEVPVDVDFAFHVAVLEATGNPFVVHIGTSMYELFRETMGRGVRASSATALAHHREILAALRSDAPERVDTVIEESFEFWRRLVRGEFGDVPAHGDAMRLGVREGPLEAGA
jgi:GntR family transcriptional regulator, transcriptional repressor for pyruvate dehydrogenase complex